MIAEVCLHTTAEFSDADFAIICDCLHMKPGLAASVNGHIRNRSNTRKSVSSDFQTPRSRLEPTSRCLEIGGNTLSSV